MRIAVVTRVKNEPYVETFVRYYLAEGVDDIFLLDDDSDQFTEDLRRVHRLPQVTVISARDIRTGVTDSWTRWNATGDRAMRLCASRSAGEAVRQLSREDPVRRMYLHWIAPRYDWLINVDADEFMLPSAPVRLRELLSSVFADVDCVLCPWLQFGFSDRAQDPPDLLRDNVRRVDLDAARRSLVHGADRWSKGLGGALQRKCMFRPSAFALWMDHEPLLPVRDVTFFDAVSGRRWQQTAVDLRRPQRLAVMPFDCQTARESCYARAAVVCAHYRLYSHDHLRRKLRNVSHVAYSQRYRKLRKGRAVYDTSNVLDLRMRFRLREPWHHSL
jgi:hypothetical protein